MTLFQSRPLPLDLEKSPEWKPSLFSPSHLHETLGTPFHTRQPCIYTESLSKSGQYSKLNIKKFDPFHSYLQGILQGVIKLHNSCLVTTSITVIGCTEDRYHITIMTPVVPLLKREWKNVHGQKPGIFWYLWLSADYQRRSIRQNHLVNISACQRELTSMTSWWALDTRVRPLAWLNVSDMSCPKV